MIYVIYIYLGLYVAMEIGEGEEETTALWTMFPMFLLPLFPYGADILLNVRVIPYIILGTITMVAATGIGISYFKMLRHRQARRVVRVWNRTHKEELAKGAPTTISMSLSSDANVILAADITVLVIYFFAASLAPSTMLWLAKVS